MQVTFKPETAAESRLLAAFMNDLADLQEAAAMPDVVTAPAAEFVVPEPPAKKSRSTKKSATTVEPPAASSSTETAPAVQDEQPSPAAVEEEEQPSPAAEEAPAAKPVTIDDLRVVFGKLAQAGKREPAVAIVRKRGANGLSEVKEADRAEVLKDLEGLLDA